MNIERVKTLANTYLLALAAEPHGCPSGHLYALLAMRLGASLDEHNAAVAAINEDRVGDGSKLPADLGGPGSPAPDPGQRDAGRPTRKEHPMKPYGVRRKDRGCCPGHDKYPGIEYRCTRIAGIRRRDKHARTAERRRQRLDILQALALAEQETC